MKFRVIKQKNSSDAHSPIQVIEQDTGGGVRWINDYLDREYVRRLADKSLYSYAHSLLHFVRWWRAFTTPATSRRPTSLNRPCSITCDSSPVSNLRFLPPPLTTASLPSIAPSATSSPTRPASCRARLSSALPAPQAHGPGRPRFEISRLRMREPKLNIVPLSVDEVARFWSSFRNARDLAIVGLMLMHGLRSAEVMALNRDDALLSEGQIRGAARAPSCACYLWRRKRRS